MAHRNTGLDPEKPHDTRTSSPANKLGYRTWCCETRCYSVRPTYRGV